MLTDINNCIHRWVVYKGGLISAVSNWCSECGKVRTKNDFLPEVAQVKNETVKELASGKVSNN